MKVLHVIPSVAPRDGGPSQVIGPMCRALLAAGADVTLATTDADGGGALSLPLGRLTSWQDVPCRVFHRDATISFKYSRGLARWLHQHAGEFNLVHAHAVLSHAPLAAGRACRRAGVPYIVRPLGTVASWSLDRKAWRKRMLLAFGAARLLREAAVIHCTSQEENDDIRQTFGLTSGRVVPLGIDTDACAADSGDVEARARDPYVLALSRLDPKKNLESLIDAVVDIRRAAGAPFRLVIAGTGDPAYVGQLEERVRQRDAASYVTFVGWVTGEPKRRLLARASLFALPSRHENFGLSVLEALCASVPVVISNQVQLAADVARLQAGWVVDREDTAFRETLHAAMMDGRARAERGANARRLAEQFSWPTIAERMLAMYREAIGKATR